MRQTRVLRALLWVFGFGILVIGVSLSVFTVQNWSTPPYGIAGGLVAIGVGLSIVHIAATDLEL